MNGRGAFFVDYFHCDYFDTAFCPFQISFQIYLLFTVDSRYLELAYLE